MGLRGRLSEKLESVSLRDVPFEDRRKEAKKTIILNQIRVKS